MNSKSQLLAVFAACILLGYGAVASAETPKSAEPADTAKKADSEEANESGEAPESWFSGAAAPDKDTNEDRREEEEVVDNLDPVDPDETRPSPGQVRQEQARQAEGNRGASDNCLASTIEAVLKVDRAGRDSALSVDAQGGVVTLSGTLADEASIEHVRDLVAGVNGVSRVDTSGVTTSGTRARAE